MSGSSGELSIDRLLEVGRSVMAELDQEVVLERVLETARDFTGARYAALGILNQRRSELDRFITSGVEEGERRLIGELPRGRGVLGVLIDDPRPLRLADVGQHPRSYGFPAGHPVMRTFLGVPILIRGQAWGNLYLTEKREGVFTEADERAAIILAEWAGIAIDHARLYQASERSRAGLEKALRGLEATRDVAIAIGGDLELDHVLELIVKRGRALVDARSLVIMLRDGDDLVAAAGAGHITEPGGVRVPLLGSTSGQVLLRGQPERVTKAAARLRIAPRTFGIDDPHSALIVPMINRGEGLGVLAAFDRGEESGPFTEDDEALLQTFAASAATAVAMAKSVQADRLRSSIAAADAERRRWARDLHDETLQGLGALRVLLSTALRRGEPAAMEDSVRDAVGHIEREIASLRSLITELRPPALDDLGLRTAIESLVERHNEQSGFAVDAHLELPDPVAGERRLDHELETAIYRVVQEALTNVAKHAQADRVLLTVTDVEETLTIEVRDDGVGFSVDAPTNGFGLAGMRERASLAGGTMTIESGESGTLVTVCFSSEGGGGSAAAALASGADEPAP